MNHEGPRASSWESLCLWLKQHDLYQVWEPSVAHKGVQKLAAWRGKLWILLRELCALGWRVCAQRHRTEGLRSCLPGWWAPGAHVLEQHDHSVQKLPASAYLILLLSSVGHVIVLLDSALVDLIQYKWSKLGKYPR